MFGVEQSDIRDKPLWDTMSYDKDIKSFEEESMNIKLPFTVLEWVDKKRGGMSRQAFIVECLIKLIEIDSINKE